MAQPGIEGVLTIYPAATFDANANSVPTGTAFAMKTSKFKVTDKANRVNTTTTRGPGIGRGEVGTITTNVASITFEAYQGTELYEGELPRFQRGDVIYITWANGAAYFNGAVQVLERAWDSPADNVVTLSFSGDSQGNYTTDGDTL